MGKSRVSGSNLPICYFEVMILHLSPHLECVILFLSVPCASLISQTGSRTVGLNQTVLKTYYELVTGMNSLQINISRYFGRRCEIHCKI